jgi:hypothetical protein
MLRNFCLSFVQSPDEREEKLNNKTKIFNQSTQQIQKKMMIKHSDGWEFNSQTFYFTQQLTMNLRDLIAVVREFVMGDYIWDTKYEKLDPIFL